MSCWVAILCLTFILLPGQVHPRTDHESQEAEYSYRSILSSTSVLNVGMWSTPSPDRFTHVNELGTHCTEGLVGPRSGLDDCRKCRPHLVSIFGPSSP